MKIDMKQADMVQLNVIAYDDPMANVGDRMAAVAEIRRRLFRQRLVKAKGVQYKRKTAYPK